LQPPSSYRSPAAAGLPARPTALAILTHDVLPDQARTAARQLRRQVLVALMLAAAAFALWASVAPLSGAIVAAGFLKSELNRKTIQHQEGGIVSQVLVRDGQHVKAGQTLAVISDVRSDASLDLLQDQQHAEQVHQARLEAEVNLRTAFDVPAALRSTGALADLLARERKAFVARRATLDQQLAALGAQGAAAVAQVRALASQIQATEGALQLAREELAMNQGLVEQGFIQKPRMLALQRTVAEYEARLGQQRGDEAEAQQKIEDLKLRSAQARNAYQQQAADELKDSSLRLQEIAERLRPSADVAGRQVVKAPTSGIVMGLRLHSVGAVLGPRETLMELVPDNERLIVEARIRPQDIDHVRAGGAAELSLSAFDARVVPRLPALVDFVSPDRITDAQTGASWYVVYLHVSEQALAKFAGLKLQTGMPAEVYIATAPRSLWRYLVEPIDAFRQRALREP